MNQTLGKEHTLASLLQFVLPTVIMLVFTSAYIMVDGIFVARFVNTDALSALNIVWPIMNVVIGLAIMLASGGNAVIARKMGENKLEEARRDFSMILLTGILIGLLVAIVGLSFTEEISRALGGTDEIMHYCVQYATILLIFTPATIMTQHVQYFMVTVGQPKLGLYLTILAGISNIVFDYYFIVELGLGLRGAALATGIGMSIPATFGIFYFIFARKGTLYLTKPTTNIKTLLGICVNGSSEMVSNLSAGVIIFAYNNIMMHLLGVDGVSAITIMLYIKFLLTSAYIGFTIGVGPIISFNYGCKNEYQLKKTIRYCNQVIVVFSGVTYLLSIVLATPLIQMFAPIGSNVYEITREGYFLFVLSFLVSGYTIFSTGLFTAFSNGRVSALLSFLRTFIFLIIALVSLSYFFGSKGAFVAVTVAEVMATIVSIYYVRKYQKVYQY